LTRVVVALKIVDSFTGMEERVKARAKAREERRGGLRQCGSNELIRFMSFWDYD